MVEYFARTFLAPTASNYATQVGRAVGLTAVATGEARATLLAAATAPTLGIIVAAENTNGGAVTVAVQGIVPYLAGAAVTPGTDDYLMPDATGRLIPATEGNYACARSLDKQVLAAGDWGTCLVTGEMFDIVDA
jgi:hypothetical protein